MSKFIENDLEQAVLEWFHDLGYQIQYGPDISPGGSFSERESFGDVVLYDRFSKWSIITDESIKCKCSA